MRASTLGDDLLQLFDAVRQLPQRFAFALELGRAFGQLRHLGVARVARLRHRLDLGDGAATLLCELCDGGQRGSGLGAAAKELCADFFQVFDDVAEFEHESFVQVRKAPTIARRFRHRSQGMTTMPQAELRA